MECLIIPLPTPSAISRITCLFVQLIELFVYVYRVVIGHSFTSYVTSKCMCTMYITPDAEDEGGRKEREGRERERERRERERRERGEGEEREGERGEGEEGEGERGEGEEEYPPSFTTTTWAVLSNPLCVHRICSVYVRVSYTCVYACNFRTVFMYTDTHVRVHMYIYIYTSCSGPT